jgi:hypothetical protein
MGNADRYYRQTTASVMQFYVEFADGILPGNPYEGERFDPRVIDYRIDVERILDRELSKQDKSILLALHRDGLTQADALLSAGVAHPWPHAYVRDLEVRIGKVLDRQKMFDFLAYLRS